MNVLDASTEVSIIATDPEGVITVFNRGAELMLGYSANQVVGIHTPALFHLQSEIDKRSLKLSQAEGKPIEGFQVFTYIPVREGREQRQWTYVSSDGREIQVSLIVTVIYGDDGNISGYLGIAHDITKEIHSYRDIKAFKGILDQVLDCILMYRTDTLRLIYANDGASQHLGYSNQQLLEMTPLDFKVEFTEAQFRSNLQPLLDGKETAILIETQHQHRDGHLIPVELSIQLLSNENKDVFVGVARDISARKATEKLLIESYQYTQTILESVLDGIITIDAKGIIQSFNPASQQIFGYQADEVIDRNVNLLMPEPFHSAHDGYLKNYHATGVARIIGTGREVEGLRKDGSTFPMDLAVSKCFYHGKPIYIGLVRDITERKRVEMLKNEFISMVSHELRTPLTSINGALGLLVGGAVGQLPEQVKSMLDIAYKNSKRLALLINDLLDMEKLSSNKVHLDFQEQLLMPVVEQAMESVLAYAEQFDVRLELIARADDCRVNIDAVRLQQVLCNFLSNAVKFSPIGAQVDVAVYQRKNWARVEVIDRGSGVPDEFRSRIFQKFSQADSSDTRQKGGTGLGLAISKELVERMSGTIGFESTPGQGATFYFCLPVGLSHNPQLLGEISLPMSAVRILVVEDDRDISELLAALLRRASYQVDIAGTVAEALYFLKNYEYGAITLDLMLPDQSGIELIRQLRSQTETENLPIIVVSAYAEEGRLSISGEFNAIDWIDKPFDQVRLTAAVRRALVRHFSYRPRILHVEDDADLHNIVATIGSEVADFDFAGSLAEARAKLKLEKYSLIILDIGLPDGSGLELLAELKQQNPELPVIVLSGSELTLEQRACAQSVLVKTRVPNQDLLDTVQRLLLAHPLNHGKDNL